jgi:hypothetical protein
MLILAIFACGLLAGLFGALVGLGGGVIIIPILTLIFNIPIKSAVAISLISVCATSVGGAARYLAAGKADFRLGLFMETTTVAGAICGGMIAVLAKPLIVAVTFSLLLFYTGIAMLLKKDIEENQTGEYHHEEPKGLIKYTVLGLSFIGGIISSFLGVGGGVIKVPIMNLILKIPIKISAATSTYMIGITTAAGSLVYLAKGMVDYQMAAPLILGTYLGSTAGARLSAKTDSKIIRYILVIVILYSAINISLKYLGIISS